MQATSVHLFGVILTLGGMQFATLGLTLARSKVIASLISPHGVGVVSIIDQLVQFVIQVWSLSLPMAPVKFLSQALHQGTEVVSKIYQALLKALLVMTLSGVGIAIGILLFRGGMLGAEVLPYKHVIVVALLAVPGMAVGGLLANVLAGLGRHRDAAGYVLMLSAGSVVAAYVGITLAGVPGLYYGNMVLGALGVAAAIGYLWLVLGLAPHSSGFRFRDELRRLPGIVDFSAVLYMLGFMQPLAFLSARYAVMRNVGLIEVGYFQAALVVSSVVSMLLTQSIRLYLWPTVSQPVPKTAKFRKAREFQKTCTILGLLAALPVVLFPREASSLLFSAMFAPVGAYLFLFVVSDFLFLMGTMYQTLLLGLDDLRNVLLTNLSAYLVLALLPWVLAPSYGLWGAAWAALASRSVLLVFTGLALHRRHGFAPAKREAGILLASIIALGFVGLAFRGDGAFGGSGILLRLGIMLGIAASGYLVLRRSGQPIREVA